ncbi:ferredoxin [Candidatus Gottesmanbacteria bacterium]|nr:ferredoxin [Candidatus Gottesmanbacteria bacterium]
MKIKKVLVDRKLCIGAGTCVAISPKSFRLDKKNIAVLQDSWTKEEQEILLAAAKSCPVNAIILINEKGKRLWP